MCRGHGVLGARPQRGTQGGQGGQSRGDGSLLGCTARPRGRPAASSWPSAWPAAWSGGRRAYGACHGDLRALPWRMWKAASLSSTVAAAAPHATPGVPASPRLCSTCLHTGGISLALWPPAPGGVAPTFGWRPPALGRRAGWPVEPCVAPRRGPGPLHRGLVSRARLRDSRWRRVACPPAATPASAWRQFGDWACPSISGRGRLVASGIPWSAPPAGALGQLGAPLPATAPVSLPWRCPSGGPGAEGRGVRPPAAP